MTTEPPDIDLYGRLRSKAGQMPAHQILMTQHGRAQLSPCEGSMTSSLSNSYEQACVIQRHRMESGNVEPAASVNIGAPVSMSV